MRPNRIGFTLKVRSDMLDEYVAAHESVWPEMLEALRRHGWRNYSIFLGEDGTLFGYFETQGTFHEALAAMDTEDVNTRWQHSMAPFFEGIRPDETMTQLVEVFHTGS